MSSDFNYNFFFNLWFRISSLGILQNIDVTESELKHKHIEKNLGSIRGRQATVDAVIGNEHYPTIRRLRTHFDWLRKLSEDSVYTNGNRKGLRTDLLTQTIALVATPLRGRQQQKWRLFFTAGPRQRGKSSENKYGGLYAFFLVWCVKLKSKLAFRK